MARIRTIKPEFFRHELLQDLESDHPSLRPMLVFAALWGHCDKEGVFPWRPRQLALDILPFLWGHARDTTETQLGASLVLLWESGFIERYSHEGQEYGYIPTFKDHQRIAGKEGLEPSRYASIDLMFRRNFDTLLPGTQQGHNGDIAETHSGHSGDTLEMPGREGKGREKEKEEERNSPPVAVAPSSADADAISTGESTDTPAPPKTRKPRSKREASPEIISLIEMFRSEYLEHSDSSYQGFDGDYPQSEIDAAGFLLRHHGAVVEGVIRWAVRDRHPPRGPRNWIGWSDVIRSLANVREKWPTLEQRARQGGPGSTPAPSTPPAPPEPVYYDDLLDPRPTPYWSTGRQHATYRKVLREPPKTREEANLRNIAWRDDRGGGTGCQSIEDEAEQDWYSARKKAGNGPS